MAEQNLNYLQQKAKEWALKVVALHKTPVPPAMQGRKNLLISSAKKIKDAIEQIAGTQSYLEPMNQLGVFFVPLIGAVGISWAIAAIVKWSTDFNKFNTEVSQYNKVYNDAIASGLSVSQANTIAGNQTKKELSWKSIAAIGIPTLLIGGISLWYFTRKRGQ